MTAIPAPEPAWSADCYLCPRNPRAGGICNPDYAGTFVFDNDYPALTGGGVARDDSLFRSELTSGACRVLCYSPRHDLSLGKLEREEIIAVGDAWRRETAELGRHHAWVQVFENRGSMMGASSPHPHGQIWATTHVPVQAAREDDGQRTYMAAHRGSLLLDYVEHETKERERLVLRTARWAAVVPYWATWPFETLVVPVEPCVSLAALDDVSIADLAVLLKQLLIGYDALFGAPFPYSMGWHGLPWIAGSPHWQLHAHFYPPLLRSATVRKHMVGYELLAEPQRDLMPEEAAARLRAAVGAATPGP
jgi:UDPglucose--hexose-1-phosphate uridylyltransferase